LQFIVQESLDDLPPFFDRFRLKTHGSGGFFHGQSDEVAKLHQAYLLRAQSTDRGIKVE
jgi:hypothetical protein